MKRLNLGNSGFKSIIESNNYFVDKTLFIKEIIDTQNQLILLPHPRRFGSTLNLSMLNYFFDKNEPENKELYKNFKIWQTEVVSFMRNFLSATFKDNSKLYKGVITGILRILRKSIFSGLNNLGVYSILDAEFSDKFGVTEAEVLQITTDFNKKTDYSQIKKWYNGYKFGNVAKLYNLWSILNFAISRNEKFKTHWTNTSSNKLIKSEIKKKDADNIRQEILKLINNETIIKGIEENFVFPDFELDNELLWTLLLYSGYLTIKKQASFAEYELAIPNFELKIIFKQSILKCLQIDVKIRNTLLQNTANYLINNKIKKFEEGFKKIIGDTVSYYDTVTPL